MKNIKYRCWDNDNEQFWYFEFGHINSEFWDDARRLNWEEPEQYTGLKDKNGVEIYEGDILSGNYEILFFKGCFCVSKYGSCGLTLYNFDYNKKEIIGNIHQNPELLK